MKNNPTSISFDIAICDTKIIPSRVTNGSFTKLDDAGYNLYLSYMTGKALVKLLRAEGWELARIEGSHHILVKGTRRISVPVHGNKDLKRGILQSLKKQGGLK